MKTIKKFPLLSKNFVIDEEKPVASDDKMGRNEPDLNKSELKFPTSPKKRVEIVEHPATFVSTTTIKVWDSSPPPVAKGATEKRAKPPRLKEPTPLGVYENTRTADRESPAGNKSPHGQVVDDGHLHYGVVNASSGEMDVYAKPVPAIKLKPVPKPAEKSGSTLLPPELPPRNTPQPSPRSSLLLSGETNGGKKDELEDLG